jgi:hypothetical protein
MYPALETFQLRKYGSDALTDAGAEKFPRKKMAARRGKNEV